MIEFNAQDIGFRIAEIRNARGYNQFDFADKLNVSKSSLSNYERGDQKPNTEFLYFLSKEFNVDLHWLITGEQQPVPQAKDLLDKAVLEQTVDVSLQAGWMKLLVKKTATYIKEFTETYEFLYNKKHKK